MDAKSVTSFASTPKVNIGESSFSYNSLTPARTSELSGSDMDASVKTAVKTSEKANMELAKDNNAKAQQEQQLTSTKEEVSESMLKAAISEANTRLAPTNRKIEYAVHDKTNRVIVKIIDKKTHETIREIPPEKALDIYAKVLELAGFIVDETR